MSYGKQGYEAGKGRTFTPSSTCIWIDTFNRMLEEQQISRNRLTESLIEDGLKYRMALGTRAVRLDCEDFTDEQINVLKNEQGQKILLNMARLMLGQNAGMFPAAEQKIGTNEKPVAIVNAVPEGSAAGTGKEPALKANDIPSEAVEAQLMKEVEQQDKMQANVDEPAADPDVPRMNSAAQRALAMRKNFK